MAAMVYRFVCRNATFGPDVSKTRLYAINNRTEKGDTNAIASGKANLVRANPVRGEVNRARLEERANS